MPFLALAIPYAQSNPISYAFDTRANRHEIAIDIEKIENQSHAWQRTSHAAKRSDVPLQSATFACRTIPANDYFDNVLAELITPLRECGAPRYAGNAELRKTLGDLLMLHPDGARLSVDARIRELGLPSLLRDDPAYLPGTLSALTYDIGAHSIDIGRFTFPEPDIEQEAEFLFAGESELAFLHEGNPHASLIRKDHSAILGFHYRAAGMRGHTTLPPDGYALAIQDHTTLCDFTSQLARCQKQTDLRRSPRSVEDRNTRYDPLDLMQNGGCVML